MVIGNNREEERSIQSKLSNIPMSSTTSIYASLKNEVPVKTGDRHMQRGWNGERMNCAMKSRYKPLYICIRYKQIMGGGFGFPFKMDI